MKQEEFESKLHIYRITNIVDDTHAPLYVFDIDGKTVVLTSSMEKAKKYIELDFETLIAKTDFHRYQFRAVVNEE